MRSPIFSRIAHALALLLAWEPLAWACTPPSIDGKVIAASSAGGGTTFSASLTTGANEIVFVHIADELNGGAAPAVSTISDTAALTWARRGSRQTWLGDGAQQLANDDFWAYTSGALTGDSISVTWASAPTRYGILAVGVSGVTSSVAPFDANGSLPAYASDSSGTPNSAQVTLSTSRYADLIIVTCDVNDNVHFCTTAPLAPWSIPQWGGGTGPLCCDMVSSEYSRTTTTKLTGYVANPGGGTVRQWQVTGNALIGDDTGCGGGGGSGALQFQTPILYRGEKMKAWK